MSKRILVVDDDPVNRTLVEKLMQKENHDVITASGGQCAIDIYIESIASKPFDLIILDIKMPGVSGIDVLKTIRQDEDSRGIKYGYGNSIPIIMLTATRESWLDAFDMGCDDYIVKPFEHSQLINKVNEKL